MKDKCGDCGVGLGEPHVEGCDVEGCPICGRQLLMCGCQPTPRARRVWDGWRNGELEAMRYGFYQDEERARPDLNRVFERCRWNRAGRRWELPA